MHQCGRTPLGHHRGMTKRPFIASLVVTAVVAGCGGSSSGGERNKAGAAAPPRPQTLEIQATDAASPEAQHFAKQIEAHSGGTLTVTVLNDYPAGTPANEARLARDIRAGKVDFGGSPRGPGHQPASRPSMRCRRRS